MMNCNIYILNMNNSFIDLLKKANELNWCTRLYCTTCGSREYRAELGKIGGILGGGLINALVNIEPKEIIKISNWDDALIIAFCELQFEEQREEVTKGWLNKLHDSLVFTDWVLLKIIKYLPNISKGKIDWINECIKIGIEYRYFSIVETLCLVLRKDIVNHSELFELSKEFANTSKQMQRVLRNVCKIELEMD